MLLSADGFTTASDVAGKPGLLARRAGATAALRVNVSQLCVIGFLRSWADEMGEAFAYLDGEKAGGVTLPGWWAKQVSIYQTAELALGTLAPGEHTLHVEVRAREGARGGAAKFKLLEVVQF